MLTGEMLKVWNKTRDSKQT